MYPQFPNGNPNMNWNMPPNAFPNQQPQAQPVPQPPQPQPAAAPNQQRQEAQSSIYLILKLAFLVYIFSQGGNTTRTILLSLGAFFIFL